MDAEKASWCLSEMANGMERSRILSIAADVRALIAEGREITAFTVGDFSPAQFSVPDEIIEETIEAFSQRETNYPPAAGLPEVRTSLAEWMSHRYGVDVGAEGIILGSGARPVLYASFRLFLEPGDGLAYGVPAWNNHYYVHLNDAKKIPIKTSAENRFLPTAEQIFEVIGDIRVLILNSPLNPTGTCFSSTELQAICEVILNENNKRKEADCKPVMLVFDQVYSTMTTPGVEHVHPVQCCPEIADYTVTLDAISKSLTATGLRLGWMAIPAAMAPPVIALIGHMGAWPTRPLQKAVASFYSDHSKVESYVSQLNQGIQCRMEALMAGLDKVQAAGHAVDYVPPQGGIYLSTRFNLFEQLGVSTNEQIRQWLLQVPGIAVVPFQAFGLEDDSGWFRISVGAVSVEDIEFAMQRLLTSLSH
jgi:aspartate aminotransferase